MAAVAPETYPEIPPSPPPPCWRIAGTGPPARRHTTACTLHLDYSAEHPTDDITAKTSCG